jgi:hypothetical protein
MKWMHIVCVLAFAAMSQSRADAPWANAEHLLFVRIETEPAGATLKSIPEKEGLEPTVIGETPLVIPVEMNWDRKYLRKRWNLLHVSTRGGIATNLYDKESKEQTVLLNFTLEKDGYTTQVASEIAGVFQYNQRAEDWDHAIEQLPERRTLILKLVPEGKGEPSADRASSSPRPAAVPTVIIARGGGVSALGYVKIEGPAGATVICDGVRAGKAPLRIMLPVGEHHIQAMREGTATDPQPVKISEGKTETLSLPPGT